MKTDAQFLDALQISQSYVAAVASWMASHSCDVVIRPVLVRPDFESRYEYADSGDIEIRQRVEVKQRSFDFTSAEDYPYPTVIVDEKFKIDRIPPGKLWGHMIVNRAGTHVCCVKPSTRGQWMVERKFDSKDAKYRHVYVCRKELCSFCRLA